MVVLITKVYLRLGVYTTIVVDAFSRELVAMGEYSLLSGYSFICRVCGDGAYPACLLLCACLISCSLLMSYLLSLLSCSGWGLVHVEYWLLISFVGYFLVH